MDVRRQVSLLVALLALLALLAAPARAADHPVSGRMLAVRAHPAGAFVKFATKDPAFPFPTEGGQNDPAEVGITLEVFTAGEGAATASAPPGLGAPGWKVIAGSLRTYRYASGAFGRGDLQKVLLRDGRLVRLRGRVGLPLDVALGAVAVRVTRGFERACALFDVASVNKDNPGRFVARNAPAPALSDCSDDSLLVALGFDCPLGPGLACGGTCPGGGVCAPDVLGGPCRCNFPTQPCGVTAPVCNGACPPGDACWPMDNLIPGSTNDCQCAPEGIPPCGATGLSCGAGACPDGSVCTAVPGAGIYDGYCACLEPETPCGPGFGVCPPDLQCLFLPPGGHQCLPTLCGGTYPACGGGCGIGQSCSAASAGGLELCLCTSSTASCNDPTCSSGLGCPPGQVCTIDAGRCSCDAP